MLMSVCDLMHCKYMESVSKNAYHISVRALKLKMLKGHKITLVRLSHWCGCKSFVTPFVLASLAVPNKLATELLCV